MIEIVDDFLPQGEFEGLKDLALGGRLPWFWASSSVHLDDGCPQFSHTCYDNLEPVSPIWQNVAPIISKINPYGLMRVKFNATARTHEIVKKPLHYDITSDMNGEVPIQSKICIYYLNTCDGYTYFEQGDVVPSVANRAVFFTGDLKHAGTSTTDADLRVVLNINFM